MAGRPRSFDKNAVLLIAMEEFWTNGYDETTIASLTAAMGVTPPSLYAAFGDKDSLFDVAVRCYVERISVQIDRALGQPTAHEGIDALLRVTADANSDIATPPGCFMLSEPRLVAEREEVRQQIAARLTQGLADGDVPTDTDPHDISSFVMVVLRGMSARAREGGDVAEQRTIATLAMAAVPPASS